MNTPIYDFVKDYQSKNPIRMHMPGHKGVGPLGLEQLDITEIDGADLLYHENGIIKMSQENASELFGSEKTLYSTQGATLCIQAMLSTILFYAKEQRKKPIIFASRNAHKSFITACAHLDIDPIWIEEESSCLLSSSLTAETLSKFMDTSEESPVAVYLTSPDYLGNIIDVKRIAKVCREHDALLMVDNAHGAYLHFLPEPLHPLDLGADIVCDSAHKTLPVLTGGAYLHISKSAPKILKKYANASFSLFASTSPSYLILQSLDLCNAYLDRDYRKKLYEFCGKVVDLKKELKRIGFQVVTNEPIKITILTKSYGYTGTDLSELLQKRGLFVEFCDPDHIVLMLTPEQGDETLLKIIKIFSEIPPKAPILAFPPAIPFSNKRTTPREAMLSPFETLDVEESVGRVLSQPGVTCPPAIPIVICGEEITKEHLDVLQYYGIKQVNVIK